MLLARPWVASADSNLIVGEGIILDPLPHLFRNPAMILRIGVAVVGQGAEFQKGPLAIFRHIGSP